MQHGRDGDRCKWRVGLPEMQSSISMADWWWWFVCLCFLVGTPVNIYFCGRYLPVDRRVLIAIGIVGFLGSCLASAKISANTKNPFFRVFAALVLMLLF